MTVQDLVDRIESYPKGFEFTLPYNQMTEKQQRDIYKIMKIATDKGYVKSVSIGDGWDKDGSFNCYQNETFRRI